MKTGAIAASLILGLTISGCKPGPSEPTVTLEIEVATEGHVLGQEGALGIAGQWLGKVLPRATEIKKREIQIETVPPGLLKVTIPESSQLAVTEFLRSVESDSGLGFHHVHEKSDKLVGEVLDGNTIIPGYRTMPSLDSPSDHYLIAIISIISSADVESAAGVDGPGGFSISVTFNESGVKKMGDFTLNHTGERLAITSGNRVISAPVIREPFSTGCLISGAFSEAEAARLAAYFENPPPLAFKLKPAP